MPNIINYCFALIASFILLEQQTALAQDKVDNQDQALNDIIEAEKVDVGLALNSDISKRINSDPVTDKLVAPNIWDFLAYFSADNAGEMSFDEIDEEIIVEKEKTTAKLIKKSERHQAYNRLAELYFIRFKSLFHEKLGEFREKQNIWLGYARTSKRPFFFINKEKMHLDVAYEAQRKAFFRFPQRPPLDFGLYNYSFLIQLTNRDNATGFLQKLFKLYPYYEKYEEAELLFAEIYFNLRKLKDAYKIYKKLSDSSNNKIRRFAMYRLAWLFLLQKNSGDKKKEAILLFNEVVLSSRIKDLSSAQYLKVEAVNDLIRLYSRMRTNEDANEFFSLIKEKEAYWKVLERKAFKYLKADRTRDAILEYEAIVKETKVRASNPFTYKNLLKLYYKVRNLEGISSTARTMANEFLKPSPWALENPKMVEKVKPYVTALLSEFAHRLYKIALKNDQAIPPAIDLLQTYLTYAPDAKDSVKARTQLANLQVKTESHEQAALNYQAAAIATKKRKLGQNALVQMKLASDKNDLKPALRHPINPPQTMPNIVKVYTDFAPQHFEIFKRELDHYFFAAQSLFDWGYYKKSAIHFSKILAAAKNNISLKQQSSAFLVMALYYSKQFPQVYKFVDVYMGYKKKDNKVTATIAQFHQMSAFAHAAALAKNAKTQQAIQVLTKFTNTHPKHSFAAKSLFLGYRYGKKAGLVNEYLNTGLSLIKSYPRSEYYRAVALEVGDSLMRSLQYEKAGLLFAEFIRRFPSDSKAEHVLLKGANSFYALGSLSRAIKMYTRFAERFPQSNQAAECELRAATALSELGKTAGAILRLQNLVQGRVKASIEQQLIAKAKLAANGKYNVTNLVTELKHINNPPTEALENVGLILLRDFMVEADKLSPKTVTTTFIKTMKSSYQNIKLLNHAPTTGNASFIFAETLEELLEVKAKELSKKDKLALEKLRKTYINNAKELSSTTLSKLSLDLLKSLNKTNHIPKMVTPNPNLGNFSL